MMQQRSNWSLNARNLILLYVVMKLFFELKDATPDQVRRYVSFLLQPADLPQRFELLSLLTLIGAIGLLLIRYMSSKSSQIEAETKELDALMAKFKKPEEARAELRRLKQKKQLLEAKLKQN